VGNPDYVAESAPLPDSFKGTYAALAESGSTVIAVARGDTFLGAIAIADEIRAESVEAIKTLHKLGIKVVMLTGDNARVAANIAKQAGVDDVYAELLPEDKTNIIRDVQAKYGRVVMVGDGVNDAPAMATADVGIAMGAAGTDVALETADVVLMGDRLDLIPFALSLSRKAYRVVWQNLSFSIGVIVLLVISTFFFELTLPLGVLGHEGSTVIVVLNGLIQLLLIPTLQHQRSEQRQALTKTAIA
jgi:Cd2+/Zn2+-exporting ATPase